MHTSDEVTFPGKLVAFEGIDCAGKSSVISSLPELLRDCSAQVTLCGEFQSPISETLRRILSDASPLVKTLLFAADRAWTYETACLPALRNSSLVLWDRYVDSAIAYRAVELSGGPQLIDLEFVRFVNSVFPIPDLTIYIDIDGQLSQTRAETKGREEPYSCEFLERVRGEYAKELERKRWYRIDGNSPLTEVAVQAAEAIRINFQELFDGSQGRSETG
jgi:dTMP kinase